MFWKDRKERKMNSKNIVHDEIYEAQKQRKRELAADPMNEEVNRYLMTYSDVLYTLAHDDTDGLNFATILKALLNQYRE